MPAPQVPQSDVEDSLLKALQAPLSLSSQIEVIDESDNGQVFADAVDGAGAPMACVPAPPRSQDRAMAEETDALAVNSSTEAAADFMNSDIHSEALAELLPNAADEYGAGLAPVDDPAVRTWSGSESGNTSDMARARTSAHSKIVIVSAGVAADEGQAGAKSLQGTSDPGKQNSDWPSSRSRLRVSVRERVEPHRQRLGEKGAAKAKAAMDEARRAASSTSASVQRLVRTHKRQEALLACQLQLMSAAWSAERARTELAAEVAAAAHKVKDSSITALRTRVSVLRGDVMAAKQGAETALMNASKEVQALRMNAEEVRATAAAREVQLQASLSDAEEQIMTLQTAMEDERHQNGIKLQQTCDDLMRRHANELHQVCCEPTERT